MSKGETFLSASENTNSGKLKRYLKIIIMEPDRDNQARKSIFGLFTDFKAKNMRKMLENVLFFSKNIIESIRFRHHFSKIDFPDNQVLVVSVTTLYPLMCDNCQECITKRGEHPFVKHDSWIDFSKIQLCNEQQIDDGIMKG